MNHMIDGISIDPELNEEAFLERIAEIWLESVRQMAVEEMKTKVTEKAGPR